MSGPQPRPQPLADAGASLGGSSQARGRVRQSPRTREASIAPDVAVATEMPEHVQPADLRRFVRVLLTHDEQSAHDFAAELLERGVTSDRLYEGIFAESARQLGAMWLTDDCTFYDVTLASGRIQRLIREFSHQFLADYRYPGSTGRLLLCSSTDEQHSLGIAVLAEFFVRDGWDVHVGPGLASEGLLDKVRETEYNLLGFSVAVTSRLARVQQDIRRARQVSRNTDIKVVVGGSLINEDPSLAERLGADGYASDAASALAVARRVLSA